MKKITYLFSTLMVVTFLNSCKGPAGEVGPAGPAGAAGAAGPKGDVGTVNISTTGWIKVTKETYAKGYRQEDNVFYTGVGFSGNPVVDKITQKTLDEGIVLAYNRLVGGSDVYLIPFDYYDGSNHITYSLNLEPKSVNFYVYFSKAIDPKTYFVDEEVRIVVIPPASGARLASINWKDYNEVKKAFDLKD